MASLCLIFCSLVTNATVKEVLIRVPIFLHYCRNENALFIMIIIIIMKRLSLLHAHDSLALLKNSLAMPKLLFILRTADCSGNQLLEVFDSTLRAGLSKVLNVDLNDDQWLQASLPGRAGDPQCPDAGTFRLSGISCIDICTSAINSPRLCEPAGRPFHRIH